MLMLGAQKSRPSKMLLWPARTSCTCLMRPSSPMADGHLVDGRRVEGGSEADGLRKLRGAVAHDAVQRLAPPVVGGHVEPGNGARLIHQLRDLLFQLHAAAPGRQRAAPAAGWGLNTRASEASCAPAIQNPGQTANPAATNHNPSLFIAFLAGRENCSNSSCATKNLYPASGC